MKTFKEIYKETVKNNGCNAGETFAKSMFEAGQKSGINEYLKGITSWEDCFQLAQFLLIKMTRAGIGMNAAEVAISVEMNHPGWPSSTPGKVKHPWKKKPMN